jgi:hypothetical protein
MNAQQYINLNYTRRYIQFTVPPTGMSEITNAHYRASIETIKMRNGGVLPSELYLHTNIQLIQILFDETGKWAPQTTSKKALVERIERHRKKAADAAAADPNGNKRGRDEDEDVPEGRAQPKKAKAKRGCLSAPTPGNIREMMNILNNTNAESYSHKELEPMYRRMGVMAQYPHRDSKKNIVNKMCEFARRNLEFHSIPVEDYGGVAPQRPVTKDTYVWRNIH